MKINLERTVPLPVPADVAWRLLGDVKELASCLPGAKITERLGEDRYKGTVSVKLGPATVSFKGELHMAELDGETRHLRMTGRGSDAGGSSGASMELAGTVRETGPTSCELTGNSEVSVTGKVAAFGSRLMGSVSDALLKQFFANLQTKAEAAYEAEREATMAARTPSLDTSGPVVGPPMKVPASHAAQAEPKLNAFALAWAVLKSLIGGLLQRTRLVQRS